MCPCWRLAKSSLVGGVCVCVPAGDLLVESCRWGLCVCPCWRLAKSSLVGGVCVCVPAGDLLVESCRWGLCVSLLVESGVQCLSL